MFGKILFIAENVAHVESTVPAEQMGDLLNVHVVFEDTDQHILGEVEAVENQVIKIRFLGEFQNGKYISGVLRKPTMGSKIRKINDAELKALVGIYNDTTFKLGDSALYKGFQVFADINNLFANHMAIFGNTGSGKSCGVARIVQNIFSNPNLVSYNANLFIFDAYGEYKTAFKDINKLNNNYNYKFITTKQQDPTDFKLTVPFHLLNLDDLTILLQVDKHSQIPILERALKLTKIFSKDDLMAEKYKDHLIAKALIAILYSNQITAHKKNEIFKILEVCHTPNFDFGSTIQGLGYSRTLSECFEIDSNGNFGESVLITDYILDHIDDDLDMIEEPINPFYTIKDFADALEFTLISEGVQDNEQLYDDSMLLKVRLKTIINSNIADIYTVGNYVSLDTYITSLLMIGTKKAQVININLEDIDDTQAKSLVKIMSRIFFDYCKNKKDRATMPFHIFLEEAHRYVHKDADVFLLGYNIFERIAKEGRKYGVLLDIISQRPVEISETVISQCSNFLIFKMTHPKDIEYIRTMLPNISNDVIEKQKSLQPGNCVCFGNAFKLPMVVKMQMPNPAPNSNSCDVNNCWRMKGNEPQLYASQSSNDSTGSNATGGGQKFMPTVNSINQAPDLMVGVPQQQSVNPNMMQPNMMNNRPMNNQQGMMSNQNMMPNMMNQQPNNNMMNSQNNMNSNMINRPMNNQQGMMSNQNMMSNNMNQGMVQQRQMMPTIMQGNNVGNQNNGSANPFGVFGRDENGNMLADVQDFSNENHGGYNVQNETYSMVESLDYNNANTGASYGDTYNEPKKPRPPFIPNINE